MQWYTSPFPRNACCSSPYYRGAKNGWYAVTRGWEKSSPPPLNPGHKHNSSDLNTYVITEPARSQKLLEINRKRNRNARAAAETAEMFLQKGQLTGHCQSAVGPFG